MKLVTAAQMREIDRISIEERGIPAMKLMEAAGKSLAMDVAESFEAGRVAVLCGKGNNGGDGYVAARHLARAGWEVTVIAVEDPEGLGGCAREAFDALPGEVSLRLWGDREEMEGLLLRQDAAIDALLGTGAKGRPRPPYDDVIEVLNAARLPVFSADLPSGLDPDTGEAELAVIAFRTVTMGLPKVGLVSGRGAELAGGVRVEPLLFPADLLAAGDSPLETLTAAEAAALLPHRPLDGHKGTFGTTVIAAGSASIPGAAILAGLGALRGGCGLVRMLVPAQLRGLVMGHLPEVLLAPATWEKTLGPEDLGSILSKDSKVGSVVFGPGVGLEKGPSALLARLLGEVDLPMVLDADALTLIAGRESLRGHLNPSHVLTPHPGELARLLGTTAGEIQRNRWGAVRRAAEELNAVVLLKGRGTLVAEPSGRITHIAPGNTAWARGGAGDVLAGLLGSLLAQGMPPAEAARLGAFVHGMAADLHARKGSTRAGRIAEIAGEIPFAFKELESPALRR